jgi:VWFA-related protein
VPRAKLLVALLAVVTLVHAQDQPRPTFRTEANYVRVDAYPTKGGTPVDDLTRDDFDVLENGQPQKLEQFERILIRGNVPQDQRREPNTVAESRQAAQNPRARVFVVFLDVNHVGVEGSNNIRKPLVDALDRLIGADDVVAVMTPEMSAASIAFARKTTTIEGFLTRHWPWGERNTITTRDPQEDQYRTCYPGNGPTKDCRDDDRGVADEMIARRRERQTMSALEDLVRYLRGVREERKAILVVSEGWRLFPENPRLARQLYCVVPAGPKPDFDPRTGRLTTNPAPTDTGTNPATCDAERQQLAYLDDEKQFRQFLDEANRANASFYPIDPRGLPVFDEPPVENLKTGKPAPGTTSTPLPSADAAGMSVRLTSLRRLAEGTDGLAILNSNDLAGGLRRVTDDLSSYYLLGYYSGGKLDGKFHPISVRVKRPGVQVRARRGYLAAMPDSVTVPAAVAAPGSAATELAAVTAAIAPLANYGREVPLRTQVAAGWKTGTTPAAAVWVVGELGASSEIGDASRGAAEASVELTGADGRAVASVRKSVTLGARSFRVALEPAEPLTEGDYKLLVRVVAGGTLPSRDSLTFTLPAAPGSTGAIWFRRGPTTGNRDILTADLRFRRSEQVQVEIPARSSEPGTGRLLDRVGKPLAVPVSVKPRDDPDGSRWVTARLALAPLAPADYVIEVSQGTGRALAAFRVIP